VAHPGWDGAVLWAAVGYGLLIANILLINAWPDAPADASVGKRTAVVCLGVRRAAQMYGVLWLSAYAVVAWAVAQDALPPQAGWVGVSVPTGVFACVCLWRHAHAPARVSCHRVHHWDRGFVRRGAGVRVWPECTPLRAINCFGRTAN
jgi:1,4-dihydroxy-2-naphthoate octaprenyltransferase